MLGEWYSWRYQIAHDLRPGSTTSSGVPIHGDSGFANEAAKGLTSFLLQLVINLFIEAHKSGGGSKAKDAYRSEHELIS